MFCLSKFRNKHFGSGVLISQPLPIMALPFAFHWWVKDPCTCTACHGLIVDIGELLEQFVTDGKNSWESEPLNSEIEKT